MQQSYFFQMPILFYSLKSEIYVLIIVAVGTGIISMIFTEFMTKHDDMASPAKFQEHPMASLSSINIWDHLSKMVPSAPINFMRDRENKGQENERHCVPFPKPWEIFVVNRHWQQLKLDIDIYLYSAHFDDRHGVPVVRIISMIER